MPPVPNADRVNRPLPRLAAASNALVLRGGSSCEGGLPRSFSRRLIGVGSPARFAALCIMATDYKNTLNLPRTDFPMKADLVKREPLRLAKWHADDLYHRIMAARSDRERFILHDGPPFANGDVHIGTALNKSLKDFILKYQTLRGKAAPYVPGWDCHGLPIEFKVSQEMRKAGDTDVDPVTIRRACESYALKFVDIQREQFKRLGVLGEWDRPYLTLNKEYEAAELRLFADIVEKGFVYRGKKPVYWSIPCRTALAEAEVEYQDHVSQSVYVKFPLIFEESHEETRNVIPANAYVLIWTTTPWTLPANLAVAYNSDFEYCFIEHQTDSGLERLLVERRLAEDVVKKVGLNAAKVSLENYPGSELLGWAYKHPFIDRVGKLLPGDNFVTNETGTGFVHIAPGHGQDDYLLGRSIGLPIYSPVDDNGRLTHTDDLPVEKQMPPELIGKAILEKAGKSDANEAVIGLLTAKNALLFREDYHHSYPHCWRSKTPVIFRAMDQWFVKIDHGFSTSTFREQAVREIESVNWIPDWGKNRILGAVQSRPDWCISRQRTWGVPIPAFYDADGCPFLDAVVVRNVADLIEQHGSNVWFESSCAELWQRVKPVDWSGPDPVEKSHDTLDVWIDSGSSSRAVIAQREELRRSADGPSARGSHDASPADGSSALPFQADMYLEGSDQHRGWFQSSLLLSLAGNGDAPYKTVLTHGFMVDADREKISKSKQGQGGYVKPQTADAYIKDYGADVVRLWVASQDFRNDIVVSDERVKKVGETYRGIRNALRYQLSNLYDFDPEQHAVPDAQLTPLDRWILWKFCELESEVAAAYDRFEFHVVYQRISQFVAVELSAIYHDLVKDRLYTDPANSTRRRSTQTTLHRLVTRFSQMVSPLIVFTADEAWEFIPGKATDSVHLSEWTPGTFAMEQAEQDLWTDLFELRAAALTSLEDARRDKVIGKALEAKVNVGLPAAGLERFAGHAELFRELLNVSQLDFLKSDTDARAFKVTKADGQKCERCWHWETSVGEHADHPTLCARCVEAVTG